MTMKNRPTGATPSLTDAAIRAMLDQRAGRADAADLRRPILTATSAVRQGRDWHVRLSVRVLRPMTRMLVLALIAAAMAGLVLTASGALHVTPQPVPTPVLLPKAIATTFELPFEYAIPTDSALRPAVGEPAREIVAWVEGNDIAPGPDTGFHYGGQGPDSGIVRGIIVASGEKAWSHGINARFMLRTKPDELLADLRDVSRISMGAVSDTTLDGRPALTVSFPGTGTNDIHVNGSIKALSQDYLVVTIPSRLIVADVDGTTILVLIWARTADDLTAWMPVASRFVDSIHFVANR